jgi:hypothetical protein
VLVIGCVTMLIGSAPANLPAGPIRIDDPFPVIPPSEATARVEAPRDEYSLSARFLNWQGIWNVFARNLVNMSCFQYVSAWLTTNLV